MITLGVVALRVAASSKGAPKPMESLPTEPVAIEGAALKGNPNAPVALIGFFDFECPVCGRFSRTFLPTIQEEYIDSGKVVLAFKHFPLENQHPLAFGAAQAAECAGAQGKFWEVHDWLFEDRANLNVTGLPSKAPQLNVNVAAFNNCMAGTMAEKVRKDWAQGSALSIRGTPSLLVGIVKAGRRVQVTSRFTGIPPGKALTDALDIALATSVESSNRK